MKTKTKNHSLSQEEIFNLAWQEFKRWEKEYEKLFEKKEHSKRQFKKMLDLLKKNIALAELQKTKPSGKGRKDIGHTA